MSTTQRSHVVANLVQGVSQQSSIQRRDSQCEAQENCLNSAKAGATARNGAEVVRYEPGTALGAAYSFEVRRGQDELYVVMVQGGGVYAFNLLTGAACTMTYVGYAPSSTSGYFSFDGGAAVDSFCHQTVEDTTFVASKLVAPALDTGIVSSVRPREALVYFKAGGYKTTYNANVRYAGIKYGFAFTTVDNSVPTNAGLITTGFIASVFYQAMSGLDPATAPSTAPSADDGFVGGQYTAVPSSAAQNGTLVAAGFQVAINGNLIRIWRTDGNDFEVDVADGQGDQQIYAFKDTVRAFQDLPRNGFKGFLLRVNGVSDEKTSDYYVEYTSKTATAGAWRERTGPGTLTTLRPDTMPHLVVNTGLNAFTVKPASWSTRIAGDGTDTAKNPGFVGRPITALSFTEDRLVIETEGTLDMSKARNVYTHFPDTVQTVLADAPINIRLAAADTSSLLRRLVVVDESLYAWADGAQFRVTAGQQDEALKQDTVRAPASTYYEFADKAGFGKTGAVLYFASEDMLWATIRSISYQGGKALGDTDVTAHISSYIPGGCRQLIPSDTGQMLVVRSIGATRALYIYNYLVQGKETAQSAWNRWTLPEGCTILWATIRRKVLYLAIQRPDGFGICRLHLNPDVVDADAGAEYRTRLDLRLTEAQVSGLAYNAVTDTSTFTLPFVLTTSELAGIRVVARMATADYARGHLYDIDPASYAATIGVKGNLTGVQFYVGIVPVASRDESEFFLRGQDGAAIPDSLTIVRIAVECSRTAYTRIEVTQGAGQKKAGVLATTRAGSGSALGSPPALVDAAVLCGVSAKSDACAIRLVNDTPFPSRWQSARYTYEVVSRAQAER